MLQFELTADDYVAGNFLAMRWTRACWLRVGVMSVVLFAFILWKMPHDQTRALMLSVGYLTVLTLGLLSYRFVYVPWHARRVFRQTKALHRPYVWSWNDEQLNYKTDLATGIVPWTNLAFWRESETMFALYASSVAFFLVPKRAFATSAELDAFRAMLAKKISANPPPEAAF